MRNRAHRWVVALAAAVVLLWAVLDLSTLRMAAALACCLVVPGLGWARKLRPGDVGDTLGLAVVLSICATATVGTAMTVSGRWSTPSATLVLAAVGLLGLLPLHRVWSAAVRGLSSPPGMADAADLAAWVEWYDQEERRSAERDSRLAESAEETSRVWVEWYAEMEEQPRAAGAGPATVTRSARGGRRAAETASPGWPEGHQTRDREDQHE